LERDGAKIQEIELPLSNGRILALTHLMIVRIKENSWLAHLAAKKLRSERVAMVIGKTIHLFHTTREEFLADRNWVCHELAHVKQYQRLGVIKFLLLYLFETAKHGYRNNRFEAEARKHEKDHSLLSQFTIT
jgi:hypothetical protein